MSLENISKKLIEEFCAIKIGNDPAINSRIQAVVVLSGESGDPAVKTSKKDTEQRTSYGIKIYKEVYKLQKDVLFILNGTKSQNKLMRKAAEGEIRKIKELANPQVPFASTLSQITLLKDFLEKTSITNVVIVTHAYHGPRVRRLVIKYLANFDVQLFLTGRKMINDKFIVEEARKISKYFGEFDIKMKTVAIIQARMSSTRLPGKILMKINRKPLLWYVVNRLKASKSLDKIIVATSKNKSDDVVEDYCKKKGIDFFRGNLKDVLGRYFTLASKEKADIIVRITGDCPLIDGSLLEDGLNLFKKTKADYLSNTLERTFSRGFDFEIFTFETLERAFYGAKTDYEREHVTPYIRENRKKEFNVVGITDKINRSNYRVTVDEIDDFKIVKILIEKFNADKYNFRKIVEILDRHPEIANMNRHVIQKS